MRAKFALLGLVGITWIVTFAIAGGGVLPALAESTSPQASALAGIGSAVRGQETGRVLEARPTGRRPPDLSIRFTHMSSLVARGMSNAAFAADLDAAIATNPDLLTATEVSASRNYRRPGYVTFRSHDVPAPFVGELRVAQIMWKEDRFTRVDSGYQSLGGGGRYFMWVRLNDNFSRRLITVVQTHWGFTNAYGSAQIMANTLRPFMNDGPLFIGGDFNAHYHRSGQPVGNWPAPMHRVGLRNTMDVLGPLNSATHDGGGTIDFIFFNGQVRPTSHLVTNQHSDHRRIDAVFVSSD